MPAEALSLFKQLFADGMGSTVVTSVEEGRPTARSAELAQTVGSFESKLEALKTADAVITIGVDLSRNHQVAGFFAKRIRPQGVPLIVIDLNENGLDPIADVALKPEAGQDAETIGWLLAAAQGEAVSDPKIAEAAQLIKKAQKPVIVYGKGLIAFNDPSGLQKLIEYAKAIGANVIGVKGEANSLVASQYQLDQPFALNGHQAAYVAIGDDYVTERLLQRLEKAPFLVAQASYASKLTQGVHVRQEDGATVDGERIEDRELLGYREEETIPPAHVQIRHLDGDAVPDGAEDMEEASAGEELLRPGVHRDVPCSPG